MSPSLTWTHLICFISSFWGIPPKTIQQCINALILKNVCKWKLLWLLFLTRYWFLFSNGTCVLHDKSYIVNGGKKPTIKNVLALTSWQSPRISRSLGWILRFFFKKKLTSWKRMNMYSINMPNILLDKQLSRKKWCWGILLSCSFSLWINFLVIIY
jgi:hypothetical protein